MAQPHPTTDQGHTAPPGHPEDFDDTDILDPADVQLGAIVGDGQTAVVHQGTFKGQEVAVKQIKHDIRYMKDKDRVNLEREINILRSVSHDHLVQFIGLTEMNFKVMIVTEFCRGGDAFDFLHNSGLRLGWNQKRRIATDVSVAMDYLHSCTPCIIHRDLKSLNLLLVNPVKTVMDEPNIKVTDFGLARMLDVFDGMTQNAGTYHWMAPEVLSMENYDSKVDIYSFSMILYEVICQAVPFMEVDQRMLCLMVAQGRRPDLTKVPRDCPDFLIDMMVECWADQAEERPDFKTILATLAENPLDHT